MSIINPNLGVLRVVVHTADGRIFDIAPTSATIQMGSEPVSIPESIRAGYISSVGTDYLTDRHPQTTLEIVFPNSRAVISQDMDAYQEEIQDHRDHVAGMGNKEWRCMACETPNPEAHRICDKCQSPRHFLY